MKQKTKKERKAGFSFETFVSVLKALYENEEEELPVNELLKRSDFSRESFYRVLGYLRENNMVSREFLKEKRRGKGKTTVYKLNARGRYFYENCIKCFLLGSYKRIV